MFLALRLWKILLCFLRGTPFPTSSACPIPTPPTSLTSSDTTSWKPPLIPLVELGAPPMGPVDALMLAVLIMHVLKCAAHQTGNIWSIALAGFISEFLAHGRNPIYN